MDGISVDRVGIDLLVVVKHDIAPEGASTDDMAVCQDIPVAQEG